MQALLNRNTYNDEGTTDQSIDRYDLFLNQINVSPPPKIKNNTDSKRVFCNLRKL